VRPAEHVALEELEAGRDRLPEAVLGLQPLGDELDLRVLGATLQHFTHGRRVGAEKIDFDVRRQMEKPFMRAQGEVVQCDGEAALDEARDPLDHVVVDVDGLHDLKHGLAAVERDRQFADQELPRDVDEAHAGAHQLLEPEVRERRHDDLAGGLGRPSRRAGRVHGVAEQQLVRDHVTLEVDDRLPTDMNDRQSRQALRLLNVHVHTLGTR
jgi:hypothetical protein